MNSFPSEFPKPHTRVLSPPRSPLSSPSTRKPLSRRRLMQWKRKAWLKDHWSVPWFFQNLKCSHNIAYVHPGSSKLMRKPQKRCFFVSIRWQLSTPGKSAHRWILVQGSASAGWSAAADSDKDLALAWLLQPAGQHAAAQGRRKWPGSAWSWGGLDYIYMTQMFTSALFSDSVGPDPWSVGF